jgi:hypothetical protein
MWVLTLTVALRQPLPLPRHGNTFSTEHSVLRMRLKNLPKVTVLKHAPQRSRKRADSGSSVRSLTKSLFEGASADTSFEKGRALEKRVVKLFESRGYKTQTNVFIRNPEGNLSEIDIIASSWVPWKGRWYIECKNYSKPLPLHSVAQFKEVLIQNRLPLSRGLLVTTSTLTPRVRSAGIAVWDGAELIRQESLVRRQVLRSWVLRLMSALVLSYVAVLSVSPLLKELAEQGKLPLWLDESFRDFWDLPDNEFTRLSPIDVALQHRSWWARAIAAAGNSVELPEPVNKAASEVAEGVSVLRDKVRTLVRRIGGPDDSRS